MKILTANLLFTIAVFLLDSVESRPSGPAENNNNNNQRPNANPRQLRRQSFSANFDSNRLSTPPRVTYTVDSTNHIHKHVQIGSGGGSMTFDIRETSRPRRPAQRPRGQRPVRQRQPPVQQGQPPVQQGQPLVQQGQPPVQQGQPPVQQGQPPVQQGQPPVQQGENLVQQGEHLVQEGEQPVQQGQPRRSGSPSGNQP